MKHPTGLFILLMSLAAFSVEGEYLFNSRFELGSSGYAIQRYLSPEVNSTLEFFPLQVIPEQELGGRPVLHIRNPHREYYKLFTREFLIPPDEELLFRGLMKSTNPGGDEFVVSLLAVDEKHRWYNSSKRILVTSEWKEYEFGLDNLKVNCPQSLRIIPISAQTGELKIAELSLRGRRKVQESELEIAVQPEKSAFFLPDDRVAKTFIQVKNHSRKSGEIPLKLKMVDSDGNVVSSCNVVFSVPQGGVTSKLVEWPLRQYGYFTIRPEMNGGRQSTYSDSFAVMGRMDARPFQLSRDFCFGVNGGLLLSKVPAFFKGAQYGYLVCADLEESARLLGLAGCRLLRDHDGGIKFTDWRLMEPEEGRFDFSHFDRSVNLYKKFGIETLPCFGRMTEPWRSGELPFRPAWLKKHLIPEAGVNKDRTVLLPPIELWKRYIRAFVAHAGDRIQAYEVMNEPNLTFSAEVYAVYLKAAYEAIREVSHRTAVVGLCVTGDINGNMMAFTRAALRAGAGNYLDVASFHPYDARTLGSVVPADRQIREMKKMLSGKPLWNTELYYLVDSHEYGSVLQMKTPPHYAAWRFLTDLGEGVEQSIAVVHWMLWKSSINPSIFSSKEQYTQLTPSPLMVTYNALARHFEGATPVGKHIPVTGIVCYLFQRDGKPMAAIWNYLGHKGIRADLSEFKVLDLFGNPVAGRVLPLTERPYYLFPDGQSSSKFQEAVRNLKIEWKCPVSIGELARRFGDRVWIAMENQGREDFSGYAGVDGGSAPVELHLHPGQRVCLPLPVKEGSLGTERPSVWIHDGKRRETVPIRLVEAKTNTFSTPIVLRHPAGTFSAEITVSLQKGMLAVCGNVKDPTVSGPVGKRVPWQADGVELFFDPIPLDFPVTHPTRYHDEVVRAFISPYNSKEKQLVFWKGTDMNFRFPGAVLTTEVEPGGYSFELRLPMKELEYLGFDVKVNDVASATERGGRSMSWSGSRDAYRNRFAFGILSMKQDPPGTESAGKGNLLTEASGLTRKLSAKRKVFTEKATLDDKALYLLTWEACSSRGIQPLTLCFQTDRRGFQKRLIGPEWSSYYAWFRTEKKREMSFQFHFQGETAEDFLLLRNIRLERVPQETGRNLLALETFDVGAPTSGWMPVHYLGNDFPGGVEKISHAPAGARCLRLAPIGEKRSAVISPLLPIIPGRTYRISFWAMAEKPEQTLTVSILAWTPWGHKGKICYGARNLFGLSESWAPYTFDLQFSSDVKQFPDLADGFCYIRLTGPSRQAGGLLIDHVSFKLLK